MSEPIRNDRGSRIQRTDLGKVELEKVDGGEVPQQPQVAKERPVQSAAGSALRRLDSSGVRIVLDGVTAQMDRALRELSKTNPSYAQVASALRTAFKHLDRKPEIDAESRPALIALSGVAHNLLEAAMGKAGAARHLDNLPGQISDAIADLGKGALRDDLLKLNPSAGPLLEIIPHADTLLRQLARMYPGPDAFGGADVLTAKLDADLGSIKNDISSGMKALKIPQKDIDNFFRAFAEVRQGFNVGAASGDDMQRTNWMHTRIEVLHTLQAAEALGLTGKRALAALLGALFSDSFKDSTTFSLLWHNRGGAELTLPLVCSRYFNDKELLDDAKKVALEHQITPPIFMSGAMKFFVGVDAKGNEEIVAKIDDPNQAPKKDGEIIFSADALGSSRAKGIPGWAAPTPGTRHYEASLAAIVGDVMQYPGLDGVIKYAHDIRDPEEPRPFMRDKLIKQAVNSSLEFSYGQGMKVIDDQRLHKLAGDYKSEMKTLIETQIYPEVEARLRAALNLPKRGEVSIPYWNREVEHGQIDDEQRKVIKLVKRTMAEVASEMGRVPLDPFGHVAKRAQV